MKRKLTTNKKLSKKKLGKKEMVTSYSHICTSMYCYCLCYEYWHIYRGYGSN